MSRKRPEPEPDAYGDRTEVARPEDIPRPSVSHGGLRSTSSDERRIGNTPPGAASDTWSDDPWDRTSHAREGAQLSRLMEAKLVGWAPAQGPRRRVVVQEPEERTGGGARARLAITLAAEDRKLGALVMGWLDTSANKVELRSYAAMQLQHRERFDSAWMVSAAEYDALVRQLSDFARQRGLEIAEAATPAPPAAAPPAPAAPALPRWFWMAVGILIGVAMAWVTVKL